MIQKFVKISTTQMIAFGFLFSIVVGTILLSLPIATRDGSVTPLIDSLFTATTSVCVTGLTTVTTVEHWSLFGQLVILVLIQFGGLGIVTFTTTIMLVIGKRITLKERLLIQDAYNLNTLSGLVKMTQRIIKGTVIVETAGAFFYMFQFIPEFGFFKGVYYSFFHSVSAFCNAGIDVIGDSSFIPYQMNPLVNIVTMLLIVIGGIGFPVWWDILRVIKKTISEDIKLKNMLSRLSLHSKLVLSITVFFILSGFLVVFLAEYHNPNTIGNMSFGNKVMSSFFQSVTTRTAGFAMIPQENFTDTSSFLFLLFMFIGGSPSGTAGGVKTITIGLLVISAISMIKGEHDTTVFRRKISGEALRKSLAVVLISSIVLICTFFGLSIIEKGGFLDTIYESVSALATVGLSRNFTSTLSTAGKIVVILTMYLGRIGPITMALAFNTKRSKKGKSFPEEKVMVG